jgi:hypothetical protein
MLRAVSKRSAWGDASELARVSVFTSQVQEVTRLSESCQKRPVCADEAQPKTDGAASARQYSKTHREMLNSSPEK